MRTLPSKCAISPEMACSSDVYARKRCERSWMTMTDGPCRRLRVPPRRSTRPVELRRRCFSRRMPFSERRTLVRHSVDDDASNRPPPIAPISGHKRSSTVASDRRASRSSPVDSDATAAVRLVCIHRVTKRPKQTSPFSTKLVHSKVTDLHSLRRSQELHQRSHARQRRIDDHVLQEANQARAQGEEPTVDHHVRRPDGQIHQKERHRDERVVERLRQASEQRAERVPKEFATARDRE